MFVRKFLLPALSLGGIAVAARTVVEGGTRLAPAPPVAEPAASPYETRLAGAGIVEAASENVAVAAPLAGVVAEVAVTQGQRVERGALLLRVDDRELVAQRTVRAAELTAARAEVGRLEALPRPEDVPPARARLAAAESALEDARTRLATVERVSDPRAVSQEVLDGRRQDLATAEARASEARADLERLLAGAWAPDLATARARVATAEAALAVVETDLERLRVCAPIDGTVLQVNVRPGEHTASGDAPIVLGDLERLHVRIDLDESDAWRFRPGSPARAYVRGNPALSTDLDFVRVDPFVVPKRSLTGDSTERVDTRVLQVLYGFDASALPVYVGQQMDVFLEAPSSTTAGAATGGSAR